MKKRFSKDTKIVIGAFVILILCLVIFNVTITGAWWWRFIQPKPKCISDSDGGIKEYIRGSVEIESQDPKVDYCQAYVYNYVQRRWIGFHTTNDCEIKKSAAGGTIVKCYVNEFYCGSDGVLKEKRIECPTGKCYNGACACKGVADCGGGYECKDGTCIIKKSQLDLKMAFILVARNEDDITEEKISKLNSLRKEFEYYFKEATLNLATIDTSNQVYVLYYDEEFSLENIMKEFYKKYPDDFDLATVYSAYEIFPDSVMFHNIVKNNIEGIGLGSPFDDSEVYGSDGKLLGFSFIYNPYIDPWVYSTEIQKMGIISGLLHETGHQWCCYVGDNFKGEGTTKDKSGRDVPELEIIQQGIHFYRGLESSYELGTPMNSDHWVSNGDGTYRRENQIGYKKYHPFQLYFMGLLPKTEYGKKYKVYNAGVGRDFDDRNAVFYKEVSVNNIIEVEGERKVV